MISDVDVVVILVGVEIVLGAMRIGQLLLIAVHINVASKVVIGATTTAILAQIADTGIAVGS